MAKKNDFNDFDDPVAAMLTTKVEKEETVHPVKYLPSEHARKAGNSNIDLPDDYMMTIEEVAERVKLKRRTVYEHIRIGKLNAGKLVGSWRIKYSDYLDYVKNI